MKCDLVTEMVKEFTDLQGVVGGLYARAEGYPENVWRAVYEQYFPRTTAAPSPSSKTGALLSLADRLDTVCGCFSVGLVPSSSGDPFALRRQGNAILKIILDHGLSLSLAELTSWGLEAANRQDPGTAGEIQGFFEGRLRFLLAERGYTYDCVNASLAAGWDDPLDAFERARALEAMRGEPDFLALAAGFKRIANILAKAEAVVEVPDPARMVEPAEIALWRRYLALRPLVEEARAAKDYGRALRSLASMRSDVDLFFDKVLVMADDPAERTNRLALLRQLADLFLGIADISQIVIEQTR
jgi:glycyl-tRNA synthetase beta chain